MAQDFAKQRQQAAAPRRRSSRPAATRSLPAEASSHWSWFFSGLMAGVILAIAGYLGLMKLEAGASEAALARQGSESIVEPPVIDYGFYRDLESAEVAVNVTPMADTSATAAAVPPAANTNNAAPAVATSTEASPNYLLQAGSFQNRQDAENHRARLLLLNMSVNIVPGVVSGRTFHRVQVGPFAGRQRVEQARAMLSEQGIDSIPLLVR